MRRVLLRFRLRASFFLRAQKETKDALKDLWSLRIPFPSKPVPCPPLFSALREPTRPSPACCRPWEIEETFCPRRQGASRGWSLGRGEACRNISRFAVGVGALAGPGRMLSAPHEKHTNAPTQKTPNSSFLILKKLPRRQLRHPGAIRPAQADFRPPTQAVTAGARGAWPREFARRPQAPTSVCLPP